MRPSGSIAVLALGMAALLAFSPALSPALGSVISEDFSYTAAASIVGKGSTGGGWSGSWGASTGGSATTSKIVADTGDLSYTAGGYAITQTGTGYASGTYNAFRGVNRYLQPDLTGTIWFSILVKNALATDCAGIQFNNHADAPYTGLDYNRGLFDLMLNGTALTVHYNGVDSASLATLALGQTHLIVGQWVIGAGNDSLSVWADPADLQHIGAPLFTQSDADAGAALYLAGVFAYGSSSSGTSRQGKLDALRISDGGGDLPTAYQDVTGVSPEPATLALVLAGLAALARKKLPDTRISR